MTITAALIPALGRVDSRGPAIRNRDMHRGGPAAAVSHRIGRDGLAVKHNVVLAHKCAYHTVDRALVPKKSDVSRTFSGDHKIQTLSWGCGQGPTITFHYRSMKVRSHHGILNGPIIGLIRDINVKK